MKRDFSIMDEAEALAYFGTKEHLESLMKETVGHMRDHMQEFLDHENKQGEYDTVTPTMMHMLMVDKSSKTPNIRVVAHPLPGGQMPNDHDTMLPMLGAYMFANSQNLAASMKASQERGELKAANTTEDPEISEDVQILALVLQTEALMGKVQLTDEEKLLSSEEISKKHMAQAKKNATTESLIFMFDFYFGKCLFSYDVINKEDGKYFTEKPVNELFEMDQEKILKDKNDSLVHRSIAAVEVLNELGKTDQKGQVMAEFVNANTNSNNFIK